MRIEKGGKPTVVIAALAFGEEIANHTKIHGIPYLPYVIVDYNQSFLYLVPAATEKAFSKIVKAVTTPSKELMKHIPGEVI